MTLLLTVHTTPSLMDLRAALAEVSPPSTYKGRSLGDVKPSKASKLAARREAPPLAFIRTSFDDDSLLQVNTPKLQQGKTPHHTPINATHNDPSQDPMPPPPQMRTSPVSPPTPTTPATPATPSSPHLTSQKSQKSSLFNLFTRPNVEKAKGYNDTLLKPPEGSRPYLRENESKHSLAREPRAQSKSRLATQPQKNDEAHSTPMRQRTFSRSKRSREKNEVNGYLSASWEPPPLMQAYPQAIKHCSLKDPKSCLSGNFKARVKKAKNPENAERPSTGPANLERVDSTPEGSPEDVSRNVYALVTSGYLLEYAEGNSDKKPDKILKLRPHSAAFVADVIPGEPYVLQIVQSVEDKDVDMFASQSSLARLFVPASKRRSARSLVMVFDDPDEMNEWMITIRKEIDHLCGRRERPRTARRMSGETLASPVSARVLTLTKKSTPPPSLPSPSPFEASPDRGSATTYFGAASDLSSGGSSRQILAAKSFPDLRCHPAFEQTRETPTHGSESAIDASLSLQYGPPSPVKFVQLEQRNKSSHDLSATSETARTPFLDARATMDSPADSFHTPLATPSFDVASRATSVPGHGVDSATDTDSPVATDPHGAQPNFSQPRPVGKLKKRPPPLSPAAIVDRNEGTELALKSPTLEELRQRSAAAPPKLPVSPTLPGSPVGNAFAEKLAKESAGPKTDHPLSQGYPTLPSRSSSLQPLKQFGQASSEPSSRRTSIRGTAPLPLRSSMTDRSSGFNPLRASPVEKSFPMPPSQLKSVPEQSPSNGLGFARSTSPESSRASALSQLSGEVSTTDSSGSASHSANNSTSAQAKVLRRPSSITVNTDHAPFLASSRSGPSPNTAADTSPQIAQPPSKRPSSTKVPIIRPPSVRPQLRLSRSSPSLPPAQPPPVAPLPPCPPVPQGQAIARVIG